MAMHALQNSVPRILMGRFRILLLVMVSLVGQYSMEAQFLDCELKYRKETGIVLHSSYKDGTRMCCLRKQCPPGYEPVLCGYNDPNSTDCRQCPPNTFQPDYLDSDSMVPCGPKTVCPDHMKAMYDNSKIRDRQCICDLEKGSCNPSRHRSSHCRRGSCPPGMQLNLNCTCSDCLEGFYKDTNGSMPCQPWTDCADERKETVTKGSKTSDAVCGNLTEGSEETHKGDKSVSISSPTSEGGQETTIIIGAVVIGVTLAAAVIIVVVKVCARHKKIMRSIQHLEENGDGEMNGYPHVNENGEMNGHPHLPGNERSDEENMKLVPVAEHHPTSATHSTEREVLLPNTESDETTPKEVRCSPVPPLQETPPRLQETQPGEDADNFAQPGISSAVMTDEEKQSINNCLIDLFRSFDVDAVFLSVLLLNHSITHSMKEIILSKSTLAEKADCFLYYLMRRPSSAYKTFIVALIVSHQAHLARRINAKLTAEFEELIENDGEVSDIVRSLGNL